MELEKLFLKKEELPILNEICFWIPIHPMLLSEDVSINPKLAKEIFPQAVDDWYNDLTDSVETGDIEEWQKDQIKQVYLRGKPQIINNSGRQEILGFWEDRVKVEENGFASGLSISRDAGGSLYFNANDKDCKTLIPSRYVKFSAEKTREFESEKVREYSRGFAYGTHNIDYYPGALFLRNWAILYMNEVFKDLFPK